VLVAARIPADVRHVIDGLDHLTRPAIVQALDHREALACPLLEAHESFFGVRGLPGFVILAANDQDVVIQLVPGFILGVLDADVVVRIGSIPVQSLRDRSLRNSRADDIGAIRGLLAVDDEPVVDRRVGANDDVVRADDVAIARRHPRRLTILDLLRVHASVDLAPVTKNRASETLQVLERVEGSLSRKAERWSAVPESERDAIDQLCIGYSGALGRFELSFQVLARILAAKEEEAFDALEIAIDVFHRRNGFDSMNRRHVTFGCQPGTFLAVHLLDVVVAIIEGSGKVGGGATRLATTDWSVVDQNNSAARAGEQIGRGHAGDAGAYDANVRPQILGKRLKLRHFGGVHPDGGRVT